MQETRSILSVPYWIAGNWKMNGLQGDQETLGKIMEGLRGYSGDTEVVIFPPATLITLFSNMAKGSPVRIGAQDCHESRSGAYTGDLSAEMLADAGACAVILGHSERRIGHGESNALVRKKLCSACESGLVAIVCVGETESERDAGVAMRCVRRQLQESLPENDWYGWDNIIVAYEPVWAIGTGNTPDRFELAEMAAMLREELAACSRDRRVAGPHILYGGSLVSGKSREILSIGGIDGALVGGASLDSRSFLDIVLDR